MDLSKTSVPEAAELLAALAHFGCTGYLEFGNHTIFIAHDGDTCPVHEHSELERIELPVLERRVTFALMYEPKDQADYRWQCRVLMHWVSDSDGLTRTENGHGHTWQEALAMGRRIASAFMFEEKVGAEDWPSNGIDNLGPTGECPSCRNLRPAISESGVLAVGSVCPHCGHVEPEED